MSTLESRKSRTPAIADCGIEREIIDAEACRGLVPSFRGDAWIYRYSLPGQGWQLSIATLGAMHSGTYSLGGFRIAPRERTDISNYDNDREALQLAIGMDQKVSRSRLVGVAGPLGQARLKSIVGGKCVLYPSPDARIGNPLDYQLLDFAAISLADFQATTGISVTTGQDLGHGTMSDGKTTSLKYLHEHFAGSITADTSKPTGEGNYFVLKGILDALGLTFDHAYVGFIGCGNVGEHVMRRVHDKGARIIAVEANPDKRAKLRDDMGIDIRDAAAKNTLLEMPIDVCVVNAAGGTIDDDAVDVMCRNEKLKIVCGCENLAMPNPDNMQRLMTNHIIYAPTEFCGMMGYLTAFEQYLSQQTGSAFDLDDMFVACKPLEQAGYRATRFILDNGFECSFDDAIQAVY